MSRTWERVRTEPGLARNTFVTVGLVVLALVAGGIILSQQRFIAPWADRYVLYATFAASPGVSPGQGQEVRIAGVQVGQIVDATVDDAGEARLELSINGEYRNKIYDNATVWLRPKSPLNEMYVLLSPGGPPGNVMPNEGVLPVGQSERPVQFDELLGNLDQNARTMLTSLLSESDVALVNAQKTLPPGLDAVRLVGNNLRPVSEELAKRKEKLRTLITALGEIAKGVGHDDKRLRQLGDGLQSTLGTLAANDKDLRSSLNQLPDLLSQLKRATDEVQGLADELDPTLRNLEDASNSFPDALDALEGTSDRLDEAVDAADPFVDKAKKVLKDLRPFAKDAKDGTPYLVRTTSTFDPITRAALPYLKDLGAFITQTRSIVSLTDANSGILRGNLNYSAQTVPPILGVPNNGVKPIPVPPVDQGATELGKLVPKSGGGTNPVPQDGSNVKGSNKPLAGLPVPSLPIGK
jgi:phospholipid/cholesterol/gamma-HCH transport system substrate-binding protein